jgi:tRNA (guanine37-N1)-methyltransferase
MKFDIVTVFPQMVETYLRDGVIGRAAGSGLIDVRVHDLRDHTDDRHRVVDDVAFGGGPGMVLKAEPFFRVMERIESERGRPDAVVLTTPEGRLFTQAEAARLSRLRHVAVLCGRYEGVDERVRTHVATEELSIGDYVLTGGELAALVILDATARVIPGVVGDEASVERDSFARGLLDFPQYTRPAELRGLGVPPVLLSGHHAEIARWRRREAFRRTYERRPDLIAAASLDDEERGWLAELEQAKVKGVTSS